jgi:DNA-binding NtrC family response regulator
MPHALIVDDEHDVLEWMSEVVRAAGFTVSVADSLASARAQLARQQPEILLTDLRLPDGSGTELVHSITNPQQTELVVITGHASVDSAVEAVRIGATDYLVKPVDIARLQAILARQPQATELKEEIGDLRDRLRRAGQFGHLLGTSQAMQSLYDKLSRVAPSSASVLLVGESGTGKELTARTLHDLSRRRRGPFVSVNCGALSSSERASQMFVQEASDTAPQRLLERASGGTLFLDEVTDLPADLQIQLLRLLETGSYVPSGSDQSITLDARIIAGTQRPPEQAVARGQLRADLYHRLNVFPVTLPPLRERGSDVELLAQRFLDELNQAEGTHKTFSTRTIERLHTASWPGNVRELRNHVQRAFILCDQVLDDGDSYHPTSLDLNPRDGGEADSGVITIRVGTPLIDAERRITSATLAHCGGVKRNAAKMLGISLKTLYNRLEAYAELDARLNAPPSALSGSSDPLSGVPTAGTAADRPAALRHG